MTLALNCAYVWFDTRLPFQYRVMTGRRAASRQEHKNPLDAIVSGNGRSRLSFIGLFALPAVFWIFALSQASQMILSSRCACR
jgi:hypothetical protein